ncbi:hypothetical protein [Streptomyces lydicus]|nr:hypothetical protein [Streptomyces lydicus]MCZ1012139.1 hypothetical protein [Streptomyces lydicus]
MNSGKTSPAAQVRARLTVASIDFEETMHTDASGHEVTEFTGIWSDGSA